MGKQPWDPHTLAHGDTAEVGTQATYWVNLARIWMRQELGLNVGQEGQEGDRSMETESWMLETCPTQTEMWNQNKWESQIFGLLSFHAMWGRLVCCAVQESLLLVQKAITFLWTTLGIFFSQWFLQPSHFHRVFSHLPLFDVSIMHSSSQMEHSSILILKDIFCL